MAALIALPARATLNAMASPRQKSEKIIKYLCLALLAVTALAARGAANEPPAPAPKELRTVPRQLCIGLQWESMPGSKAYELQRAQSPNGPFKTLPNKLPELTIYNDFIGQGGADFYYRVRTMQTNGADHVSPTAWSESVGGHSEALNPGQLLTEVQRASFDYFHLYAHPASGLARASVLKNPDTCAIGASGMGLFNLGVGVERGFITRREGAEQTLKELRFLSGKAQRFHGAFPHFINGETGVVIPFSKYDDGADIVETAFLLEGVLFAREYFSGSDPEEVEIRGLADKLWRDVEWDWFVDKTGPVPAMIWHWSPKYGWKKHLYILGFNECQIVYVLGLASPTHPIEPRAYWEGWESPHYARRRTEFGIDLVLGGRFDLGPPLFVTQFSYLGLDPRQILFDGRSYFDHFRDFCRVQIRYAESKSKVHKGYGPLWGITASSGPDGYRPFAPGLLDTGTLAPTAAISSMPYVPDDSIACLLDMYQKYGSTLWGPFGFYDSFNLSRDWVSKTYLCIDEGPIAPMIENYRSGMCWKVFMKSKEIRSVVELLNKGENSRLGTTGNR
ncbi:MAG TPA: glucoamylase family protein [Candidatus Sulfopaludibacter sp.]|nr:glucoamylase family protein [Candidatus Sulfopaludibacter sp.]